jgi:transposase
MNGDIFEAYVRQQLVPTLRPGDIVVMDNLSSHRSEGVKLATESVRATLRYLPPYSPDLNSIELSFAKLKSILCKAEERTASTLGALLGRAIDAFTPEESVAITFDIVPTMLQLREKRSNGHADCASS